MTDTTPEQVAFLLRRGVEQAELTEPWAAVRDAGWTPVLVSDQPGTITALVGDWDRGDDFPIDVTLDEADPDDYIALVLPGGTINADKLRTNPRAIAFAQAFASAGAPIAAICHGPWLLIEAGLVRGRTLTSTPRIATDLRNAGAHWVDQEVVVDGSLITSRSPRDLPAFDAALVRALESGDH